MLQLKGFILLFLFTVSIHGHGADDLSHLENPLQYYKKHYTKEELKEIHKLNMKILVELEKRTRYPSKLQKEQAMLLKFKLPSFIMSEANALGVDGRCFFGGWKTDQGPTWCHVPWRHTDKQDIKDFGPTYNKEYYCGGKDLFRCNPVIFGMPKDHEPKLGKNPDRGICIEISSYKHVTRKCTEAALKHMDEFVNGLVADSSKLEQFLSHTVEILAYCEVDKLDYCEVLKDYIAKVKLRAEECEKALAEKMLPEVTTPLNGDDMVLIEQRLREETRVEIESTGEATVEPTPQPTPQPTPVVEVTPEPTPEPTPIAQTLEQKIAAYSSSPETQRMIAKMRNIYLKRCTNSGCRGGRKENEATGACWRYVKHGLMSGNFTDEFLEKHEMSYPFTATPSAKNAGSDLLERPEVGFSNLLDTDKYKDMTGSQAPVGAILVYEGGTHGHVEVKTGSDEYISDYSASKPTNETSEYRRRTRRLIGIYVKTE